MEKEIVILSGKPTPKDWQKIQEMVDKGYFAATNLPKGVSWEVVKREDSDNEK